MSPLHRGHANICIILILVYVCWSKHSSLQTFWIHQIQYIQWQTAFSLSFPIHVWCRISIHFFIQVIKTLLFKSYLFNVEKSIEISETPFPLWKRELCFERNLKGVSFWKKLKSVLNLLSRRPGEINRLHPRLCIIVVK